MQIRTMRKLQKLIRKKKIPSDTQQMKNNRSDSKPDSSSKPNKGNLPESERRGL